MFMFIVRVVGLVTSLSGIHCSQVSAGFYHSVSLSGEGQVFAWGCNHHGQCNITQQKPQNSNPPPSNPSASQNVTDDDHKSRSSQTIRAITAHPVEIPFDLQGSRVIEIQCGWSHTIAITSDRRVFAWGRCDYGQLGVKRDGKDASVCSSPVELECLRGVEKVCCGSEHNIAITKDRYLVSWGWNEHGMCGTGKETNQLQPIPVHISKGVAYKILRIGCGSGHSIALAANLLHNSDVS
jgi:alpha-tubulin suppressor-like RCC1 family protein